MLDILIEFFTYIMQFQSHHPTQYSFLLESVSMISQDPLTSSSRTSVFKLLETTSARSAEVLQGWYPLTSLTFNIKTILRLFTDCFFEIWFRFQTDESVTELQVVGELEKNSIYQFTFLCIFMCWQINPTWHGAPQAPPYEKVLLNNSYNPWSTIKTRNRLGICSSWGFQNCP